MPREIPILFNDQMVRRILDGSKVETRRPVKPQPVGADLVHRWKDGRFEFGRSVGDSDGELVDVLRPPFGVPGNLLYVREAWACLDAKVAPGCRVAYRASTPDGERVRVDAPWRPSIHMPKPLARLWLRVEDVRVERVQEITDDGCRAEGVETWLHHGYEHCDYTQIAPERANFRRLWHDIYNPEGLGWHANPWVWVCRFSVVSTTGREGVADVAA